MYSEEIVAEEQAKCFNEKPVACPCGFLLNMERLILHTKRRFKRICLFTASVNITLLFTILFTASGNITLLCDDGNNIPYKVWL